MEGYQRFRCDNSARCQVRERDGDKQRNDKSTKEEDGGNGYRQP